MDVTLRHLENRINYSPWLDRQREIPGLDLKRSYFLFSSLVIRDENSDGETGKGRAAGGSIGPTFLRKRARLYPLPDKTPESLGGVSWSAWANLVLRGCWLWCPERKRGGRAPCSEFLMRYQQRVFSHFSVLLYKVHFLWEEHRFLWRTVNSRRRSKPLRPAWEHPLICKLANRLSHKLEEGLIQGLEETMKPI